MTDISPAIFVSTGTPYTANQQEFIRCVDSHLKSHGCEPLTVGRNTHSVRQPAEAVRDLIAKCDGAVVIAFERTRILSGLEKPGSEEQQEVGQESHPTVWNQMEAAMAYAQKVPLLILVERGLKRQGMLSDRLEWTAIETNLAPSLLSTEEFQQVFKEWISFVKTRSEQPLRTKNFEKWRVGDLFGIFTNLEAKDAWALIVTVFAIFAVVATASFKVGQWTSEPIGSHKSELSVPARGAAAKSMDLGQEFIEAKT